MTIKLRPYQVEAVAAAHKAHGEGVLRPAEVLATGAGKSLIIAEVARTSRHGAAGGKRTVIVAHREELVEGNAQEMRDLAPDLRVGVVMAGKNETQGHVVSASVATLANDLRRSQIRDVGLVVIDECFPAGTLVGGAPIETLAPGDMVPSWDETTGTVQYRPVVALMSRVPESMVCVELDTGQLIYCTPNHSLLTAQGWCDAGTLSRGAYVISFTAGVSREGVAHLEGDGPQAEVAGRERQTRGGAAASAGGVSGVAHRGDRSDERWRSSVLVQRGHCPPVDESGDRGRRNIPRLAGAPKLRPAEGESVVFARVVAVQVLEPGCDGTYGGVCPDGAVYNIEVDGTHTYLIDGGVVVHNCHHVCAPSYLKVLDHFGCMDGSGAVMLGMTATLSRGDDKALGDVIQDVVYVKDTAELIAEGYLVRPVGIRVRVEDLDLGRVRKVAGDFSGKGLGDAIEGSMAPKKIVEAMREHAADRQTILFAPLVATAFLLRDALREAGFTAEVISGKTPKEERRRTLQAYRDGAVQILCNAMVFTEGTNLPMTSCIVIARPTMQAGLFTQMCGRGLRLWPGKTNCKILDVVGATGRHRLAAPVELWGDEGVQLEDTVFDEAQVELVEQAEDDMAEQAELDHLFGLDEPTYRDGKLVTEIVDLFEGSDAGWLRTYAGVWFVAAPERYVAVLPRVDGGYGVVSLHRTRGGDSAWVMERVSELSYAMAHATGDVTEEERATMSDINGYHRKWVPGYGIRSASPRAEARRIGLPVPDGATPGEVRKMLTVAYASARIDAALPAWVRR